MNKLSSLIDNISLKTFLNNVIYSFKVNYKQEIRNTQNELLDVRQQLRLIKQELLYFKIIDHFSRITDTSFSEELTYMKGIGSIALFPYRQCRRLEDVICKVDPETQMPYVLHRGQKKLFFPKSWDIETVRNSYISLVEEQSILGGGYTEKAPHQYETEAFHVNENDTVLDIGGAEALFALEVVDKVEKVFVFECDPIWFDPLHATFNQYKDKVVIINKYVSDTDSVNQIRLDTCLKNEAYKSLFLKLDIEGSEKVVLSGNSSFLTQPIDIRIACCTYHERNDADYLHDLLNRLGYETEYSDGYMLYVHDENMRPPYFRYGLIRAKRVHLSSEQV